MYRQFRFCERDSGNVRLALKSTKLLRRRDMNCPRKNLKADKKAGRDGPAFCLGRMSRGNQDNACLTRSGENGTRRMRTPVASKIALAIAAATGRIGGSPAPVGGSSG